jgi:hypothetical protein
VANTTITAGTFTPSTSAVGNLTINASVEVTSNFNDYIQIASGTTLTLAGNSDFNFPGTTGIALADSTSTLTVSNSNLTFSGGVIA